LLFSESEFTSKLIISKSGSCSPTAHSDTAQKNSTRQLDEAVCVMADDKPEACGVGVRKLFDNVSREISVVGVVSRLFEFELVTCSSLSLFSLFAIESNRKKLFLIPIISEKFYKKSSASLD
jgi:hypothetical protein